MLKELFDDLNLQEAILLGHSMGGKVAMSFAQKPFRIPLKLIVVDMGVKAYPPHHQQIFEAITP
jgi:esterase